MKKIKTLCNWLEETNPTNYKNYISAPPDITSPDQIVEWGSLILKYDNPADASYSQTFQDLFVISVLDGKREGSFLDLGCSYPVAINNTYLLENNFEWTGVSIDIDPNRTSTWESSRTSQVITFDAGKIDYNEFLKQFETNHIDYLSIDVDNIPATYHIINDINFNEYEFSVITFEHDLYARGSDLKDHMKEIMNKNNYVLCAENVCCCSHQDPFEDWYINPKYINENYWKKYQSMNKLQVEIFS